MSFKELRRQEVIKRADVMKIRYRDLHIEPGFNERDRTDDFDESVKVLADCIFAGGTYPPLECRVADDGKVYVVDGHRRHEAIGMAISRGAEIDWIEIRQFAGNNADRVARIVTSAQGRPLSPIETSRVYKRLAGFNLTTAEIAAKVSRSVQHVTELLTLANANTDVQQLVFERAVSAKNAAQIVRQHGEKAGSVLADQLAKAQALGKKRVTAKTLRPPADAQALATPPQTGTSANAHSPKDDENVIVEPDAIATSLCLDHGLDEQTAHGLIRRIAAHVEHLRTLGNIEALGKLVPIAPTQEMVNAGRAAVRRFQHSDECRTTAEPQAMAAAARLCYAAMVAEFDLQSLQAPAGV